MADAADKSCKSEACNTPSGVPEGSVDMCLCHGEPFEVLQAMCKEREWGPDDLFDNEVCGNGCGMCRRYVRLMHRTGQNSFVVLPEWEYEELMERLKKEEGGSSSKADSETDSDSR